MELLRRRRVTFIQVISFLLKRETINGYFTCYENGSLANRKFNDNLTKKRRPQTILVYCIPSAKIQPALVPIA